MSGFKKLDTLRVVAEQVREECLDRMDYDERMEHLGRRAAEAAHEAGGFFVPMPSDDKRWSDKNKYTSTADGDIGIWVERGSLMFSTPNVTYDVKLDDDTMLILAYLICDVTSKAKP